MRVSGRRSDGHPRGGTCARSGRTRARSCLPHCLSNGAHTCTVVRELRVGQRARAGILCATDTSAIIAVIASYNTRHRRWMTP